MFLYAHARTNTHTHTRARARTHTHVCWCLSRTLHDYELRDCCSGGCGIGVARQGRSALGAVRCGPRVVGSQAFNNAKTFNANIGGWNTASVTTLSSV